jgi:DNA-binding MarR family transcriptional regulator
MHDPETLEKAMDLYLRAATALDPIRVRAWRDLELTLTQLFVLFQLRDSPGTSAGVLAEELRVTPPTVTGLVDRLVRMGLVRREEDAKDRRLVRNVLTKRGEETLGEAEHEGRSLLIQLFERLTARQLARLVDSLEVLVAAADEILLLAAEDSAAS